MLASERGRRANFGRLEEIPESGGGGRGTEEARVAGLAAECSYTARGEARSHPITPWRTWHGWMSCHTGKKKRRKWEVGFGETRWAAACWGFFASLLLLIFSLLLLFAAGFQEKESTEREQMFRSKQLSNIFEISILSQNNFQTFLQIFWFDSFN
jgi:hypothetical protein